MNYVQEMLLLKLLEEFGFDVYSLIIFSSRDWRAAKPSAEALMFLPVHIDINLLCPEGKDNLGKYIHIYFLSEVMLKFSIKYQSV